MDYKKRLGIIEDEEETNEAYEGVFDFKIDKYFTDMGFEIDSMHPRFMNGYEYKKLTIDAPALRNGFSENEYWTRIFISEYEIYLEKQSPWRSLDSTRRVEFETPPTTIEEIENALNEALEGF